MASKQTQPGADESARRFRARRKEALGYLARATESGSRANIKAWEKLIRRFDKLLAQYDRILN